MRLSKAIALAILIAMVVISIRTILSPARDTKQWQTAYDAFLANGESLAPPTPQPIPDDDNFAAIPELNGIAGLDAKAVELQQSLADLSLKTIHGSYPAYSETTGFADAHQFCLDTSILPVTENPENIAQDLLRALNEKHGTLITALLAASDRRHAEFLPSANATPHQSIDEPLAGSSYLSTIRSSAIALNLFAHLSLELDEPDAAIATIRTILLFAEAISNTYGPIAGHVQSVALSDHSTIVQHGITSGKWTIQDLAEIQTIATTHRQGLRAKLLKSVRSDLIISLRFIDMFAATFQSTSETNNAVSAQVRFIGRKARQAKTQLLTDVHKFSIKPLRDGVPYDEITKNVTAYYDQIKSDKKAPLESTFTAMLSSPIALVVKQTAKMETLLTQTATACALERYFQKNQSYPDSLEQLVPNFIAQSPIDAFDRQPLEYTKTDAGNYQLHANASDITWDSAPQTLPEQD